MRSQASNRFGDPKLTPRETDLFEALAHAIAYQTEPLLRQHHKDWAAYHLKRALQSCPPQVAKQMEAALDKFLRTTPKAVS